MNATKTNAAATSKAPSHIAYQVRDRDGEKSVWTRIGAAWEHSDGEGFNIQLNANPVDGKLTLRTRREREEE